ncbi:MAG: hypothetical protein M3478_09135 [Planctomycetota bacterium]|nr:hypothetical protein [Planctomycetota bacterium]
MEEESESPILTKAPNPSAVAPDAGAAAASADLSREIVKQLTKQSSDRLTVRRIWGNHYRCNWWSPEATGMYDNPQMGGLTVTTHRVRKSQFLRVTKSATGLSIEVIS